jgi:hypothetical protein
MVAARGSLLLALTVSAAVAQAEDPPRDKAADAIALAVCVVDADIRTAAIAQRERGATRDAALAAVQRVMPDRTYRAQAERLVAEIWRAQPKALRPYVADRLQQCAAGAARRVTPASADGCYQPTRFASDFFTARDGGVPLDNAVASASAMARDSGLSVAGEQGLAKLAASVYRTTVAAPEFRAGLFFHCVTPAATSASGR